ncbi:MAG TPA: hypothetical protein VKD22_00355 [Ramlibacter sp.]|nr:hypothetical protein [Ramlibacter sp.]
MNGSEAVTREQPIFWVGLTGFAPDQRVAIESALARVPAMPQWRIAPFREGDGWFVNGAKCRLTPAGNLRIAPGLPNELAVNLDLDGVDRPVAFAEPLASAEVEPRYRFDPASPPSVQGVLLQFDGWLRMARVQFELGRQVVQFGARLRHGIFHVSSRDKLLAVLDFRRGNAAVAPQLQPGELRDADWAKRPDGADALPDMFVSCSTSQLAWSYVRRTERDLLPARYRDGTIHYRGKPRVPLRWLRDSQLMLLKELAAESATLTELSQRTGLPAAQIERDLACLYYAAAITTTAAKAVRGGAGADDSLASSALQSHSPETGQAPVPFRSDLTVPAVLRP